MKLIQALLRHKPFSEIHFDDLQMIIERFRQCRFNEGDILIEAGEITNFIGILCEGSAIASLENKSQKTYDLKISDFYGVPSVLKMQASDVTIVCKLKITGYILKADDFFKIIGKFPAIRAYFYLQVEKRYQINKIDKTRQHHYKHNLTDKTVNYPECIQKALRFIDSNFAEQISLKELSSEIGVSRYYLSHLIKKITGRSFKQHLNIRRINAAKCLMLEESMNVSESCYAAGFNNLSYFIKVFKQYEKIRPSEYRGQNLK